MDVAADVGTATVVSVVLAVTRLIALAPSPARGPVAATRLRAVIAGTKVVVRAAVRTATAHDASFRGDALEHSPVGATLRRRPDGWWGSYALGERIVSSLTSAATVPVAKQSRVTVSVGRT